VTTNHWEEATERISRAWVAQRSRSSPSALTKNSRCGGLCRPVVAMMESAEPWHRNDLAACLGRGRSLTTGGRLFCQPEMSAIIVVVADVFRHEALEMPLVENDDMVEQIATAVADEALRNAVLPRTAEADPLRLDAECLHCASQLRSSDEKSRGRDG